MCFIIEQPLSLTNEIPYRLCLDETLSSMAVVFPCVQCRVLWHRVCCTIKSSLNSEILSQVSECPFGVRSEKEGNFFPVGNLGHEEL